MSKKQQNHKVNKGDYKIQPRVSHHDIWLRAIYHFHVFHYRMPQTASIAAVTPFIPSPLTVKFAMIASLLQRGQYAEAEKLAQVLPKVKVLIIPPESAFSFKAFLRYRSVPAVESTGGFDETGSFYPSRPHTREYALFQGDLIVFVRIPELLKEIGKSALKNIRYPLPLVLADYRLLERIKDLPLILPLKDLPG